MAHTEHCLATNDKENAPQRGDGLDGPYYFQCVCDPITEAAEAVRNIKSVADLDARAGVLKDRTTVDTDAFVFIVPSPKDLTPVERELYRRILAAQIETTTKIAMGEVQYARTWGDA